MYILAWPGLAHSGRLLLRKIAWEFIHNIQKKEVDKLHINYLNIHCLYV